MSFKNIKDLDDKLKMKYGGGIEKIVVDDETFKNLLTDVKVLRQWDSSCSDNILLTTPSSILFEGISIVQGNKSRIEKITQEIEKLQKTLESLTKENE